MVQSADREWGRGAVPALSSVVRSLRRNEEEQWLTKSYAAYRATAVSDRGKRVFSVFRLRGPSCTLLRRAGRGETTSTPHISTSIAEHLVQAWQLFAARSDVGLDQLPRVCQRVLDAASLANATVDVTHRSASAARGRATCGRLPGVANGVITWARERCMFARLLLHVRELRGSELGGLDDGLEETSVEQ